MTLPARLALSVLAWRNPVTRGFARRLQNEDARRLLDEIDFEYRITSGAAGGVEGVFYETENAKDDAPIILFVHDVRFHSACL